MRGRLPRVALIASPLIGVVVAGIILLRPESQSFDFSYTPMECGRFATPALTAAETSDHPQTAALPEKALSAANFGVVPDDGLSDSRQLQRAVAEAARAARPVYLPAGVYDIDETIELPAAVSLAGDGDTTLLRKAPALGGPIVLLQGANSRLENLAIDGNAAGGAKGDAVTASGEGAQIAGVHLSDVERNAIRLDGGSDIVVEGVHIEGAGGDGIRARNTHNLRVADNAIRDVVHGSGIFVYAEPRQTLEVTVRGNTIENVGNNETDGSRENGISIWKADGGVIANNSVRGAQMGGVRINHGSNFLVQNNTLVSNRRQTDVIRTGAGIFIEATGKDGGGSTNNRIIGNVIDDSVHGIVVANVTNGTSDNTVAGNKVSNNLNVGILFEGDGLIACNQVRDNGRRQFEYSERYPNSEQAGIHANYDGRMQIQDNRIFDDQAQKTQRYAVYLSGDDDEHLTVMLAGNSMGAEEQAEGSLLKEHVAVNKNWQQLNNSR